MLPFDPKALARWQLERDRKKTAGYAGLFEHKVARMSASPLAFLRGAAPLFYEILSQHGDLAKGSPGEGWLTGDLHLENFGAYRPTTHAADDDVGHGNASRDEVATFNLNDFDDAVRGPFRFDVLRLTTSLILGGRELGADGPSTLGLCDALLNAYVASSQRLDKELPAPPEAITELIQRVRTRTRVELLEARTEMVRGARRFVRGPRYRAIPKALAKAAEHAFARYASRLEGDGHDEHMDAEHLKVVDLAFRIAGTGSLGGLRVAVLARGKGGPDGAWVFDMKEQGTPSASILLGAPKQRPAKRVLTAMQACLAHPPRMLGTTKLEGRSMLVRRLAPQEDKLDLTRLRTTDLEPLARYLGALTGRAHLRGARRGGGVADGAPGDEHPPERWSEEARAKLIDRAITLAQVHEGAYLAMCKATRK